MKKENVGGIEYIRPKVTLLNESGIGVAEVAARTCYNSFENSENKLVKAFPESIESGSFNAGDLNDMDESDILDQLAWVHHHHSIIEHATLSFLVQGMSRGVLQEHARHRLQNISVRSTRYVFGGVLNAYNTAIAFFSTIEIQKKVFNKFLTKLDMLVVTTPEYIKIETDAIFDKLFLQSKLMGGRKAFVDATVAKSSIPFLSSCESAEELFEKLQSGKKKRNVGDLFKHTVSDNWKVDMVVTFNIRSLKNYYDLRDSGAAWFQIRWLAEEMKAVTPLKYLRLIDKEARKKD